MSKRSVAQPSAPKLTQAGEYDSILIAVKEARAAAWLIDLAASESLPLIGVHALDEAMDSDERDEWIRDFGMDALIRTLAEIETARRRELAERATAVA